MIDSLRIAVVAFAAALSLQPLAGNAKVRIVSTIPDFASIAAEVGGDLVETSSIVRPTQDPHFLDAKPSFVVTLNKADMLLLAGMELEAGWLPSLLLSARNPQIQKGGAGYLDCSTLIAALEVESPDRAKGDVHPGGNPHYWIDPRNGILIAKGIASRLVKLDPAHAKDYQRSAADFAKRMEAHIEEWKQRLAPLKGARVIVYHRSWVYFLEFSGLVEADALEPKPGIPPSPSHIAQLVVSSRDHPVRFVIQESFYPTRLSLQFSQKIGAPLKVLPT